MMEKICSACIGRGWHMIPLIKTRMDCPICDGTGYTDSKKTPEEIARNVIYVSEIDKSKIIELVEKHYGSGKAMQVADILKEGE